SPYLAVHSRIGQSKASTLTPVCMATRPVWSGSGEHEPGVVVVPLVVLPLVVVPLVLVPLVVLLLVVVVPPVPPAAAFPPPHPERRAAIAPSVASVRTWLISPG